MCMQVALSLVLGAPCRVGDAELLPVALGDAELLPVALGDAELYTPCRAGRR